MTEEEKYGSEFVTVNVRVTRCPSWSPAASARPLSAAGGGSQATELWPGHETPRRGSHRAQSPPQASAATLHFQLTRGWRPGGGPKDREESGLNKTHTVNEVGVSLSNQN